MTRHWRRMLVSALPLLLFVAWIARTNGVGKLLIDSLHVIVQTVALSATLERLVARRASVWRLLVVLEAVSSFVVSVDMLINWLGQSALLLPANGDLLPTSPRGALNLLALSQFLLAYWAVTYMFPYMTENARLRALEADRLRRVAEMAHLRTSLEPHFLLNTLNAIAGLVSEDPKEARRLIAALGDLLSDTLAEDRELETLGEQIEWLQKYGTILESRHRGRLRLSWQIAANAKPLEVPRFLLQPLVENAVNHGALRRRSDGEVQVHARIEHVAAHRILLLEVQDNGPGLPDRPVREGAKGLALVRSRLEALQTGALLRLEHGDPGTHAIVELPL